MNHGMQMADTKRVLSCSSCAFEFAFFFSVRWLFVTGYSRCGRNLTVGSSVVWFRADFYRCSHGGKKNNQKKNQQTAKKNEKNTKKHPVSLQKLVE